jgi:dethiobiotin synthetase
MSALFITGSGTDIGKTYVATQMIRHFREVGRAVEALKPVVTGFDPAQPDTSDPGQLLAALGGPITAEEIARISPWQFMAPLSPDLAAEREGRPLDFYELVEFSSDAVRKHTGTLLIEGIGGVMVPLDARHTVLDWMGSLGVPAILVCGSYLGSLSHTLTAIEALRGRGLLIRAVVVNETPGSTVTLGDTISSLSQFTAAIPLIALARGGNVEKIAQAIL